MSSHERFEELCALAAAGEVSPAERQELMAHLAGCASCERVLEEMQEIHAVWLPERAGFEIKRSFAAESRLRQSILQRVMAEGGAQFSEEALYPTPPALRRSRVGYRRYVRPALVIAAVLAFVLGIVGLLARIASGPLIHRSAPQAAAGVTTPSSTLVRDASRVTAMQEKLSQALAAQSKLEVSLEQEQAARKRLEEQLAEATHQAETAQESNAAANQEIADLHSQLDAALAKEAQTQMQLAAWKTTASDKDALLTVAQAENNGLRDKLTQQEASIERERELMSNGRDIRDLIAARNLHIIDVYDTSGEGRTQKPFGRVFYTEGKSLIFYAYDLPVRRPATKYAFYAWGKKDGSGDVKVRNLGIFYNDDQAQKRWVLKVNDPQVLAEIDSVFVTLEKTDGSGETPMGKKLLSAYLGTPANHP